MQAGFEWDPSKAAANWQALGIAFADAAKALSDPFAVERVDDREAYGEERVNVLGMCDGVLLHVTYTERGDTIRIISARRRNVMSRTVTSARIRPHGTVVQVLDDGSEQPFAPQPMRSMSEGEVSAAAAADPDARPMTDEEWQNARAVPRMRTLRRALSLTQEEFAARYHIPLGTLRDWEQGRSMPDQPARAYLKVIASDPEGVRRALDARPGGQETCHARPRHSSGHARRRAPHRPQPPREEERADRRDVRRHARRARTGRGVR